jgi:PASTA domain-containing protein
MRGVAAYGCGVRRGSTGGIGALLVALSAGLAVLAVLALSAVAAPTALAASGSVSGTVTGAPSNAPLAEVEVCLWPFEDANTKEHCAFSASDGHYEIANVDEGEYLVHFQPTREDENYVWGYYNPDHMWPPDHVAVGTGALTGIDKELEEGGSIEGQVTDEAGGEPLAGVMVCAGRGWQGQEPRCASTDDEGRFDVFGLVNEEYRVEFSPEKSGLQYFGEYYDDQRIGNGYPAQLVEVTVGNVTTGINAALTPSVEIRGAVTAGTELMPVSGMLVCIAPPNSFSGYSFDQERHCNRTNNLGTYAIRLIEKGEYKVAFSLELREFTHYFPPYEPEEDGYPTRFWNEQESLWNANVLTLGAPSVVTGIDAHFGPWPQASPPPSESFLMPLATCNVPRLLGKTLKAAKRRARRTDCGIGHVRLRAGVSKKGGKVVRQKPKADKVKAAGTKIAITLG